MKNIEQTGALEYLYQAFSYIINTNDENKAPLEALVHNQFTPKTEKTIMTMAQQYRQEGKEEQSLMIAKNLLNEKMPPEQVAKLTNLSVAKVKALLKSKNG